MEEASASFFFFLFVLMTLRIRWSKHSSATFLLIDSTVKQSVSKSDIIAK